VYVLGVDTTLTSCSGSFQYDSASGRYALSAQGHGGHGEVLNYALLMSVLPSSGSDYYTSSSGVISELAQWQLADGGSFNSGGPSGSVDFYLTSFNGPLQAGSTQYYSFAGFGSATMLDAHANSATMNLNF
jgi:hypothetical protein